MVGTVAGGIKVREKVLAIDPNYYKIIGKVGGQNGKGPNYKGGFGGDHELASRAGRIGGTISKRTKGDNYGQSI